MQKLPEAGSLHVCGTDLLRASGRRVSLAGADWLANAGKGLGHDHDSGILVG